MNKFTNTLLILLFITLIINSLNSQTLKEKNGFNIFYNDIQSSGQGAFHVITNPVRWEKNDWFILGGVIAASGLLFTVDDEIDSFFKRNQSSSLNKLADFGSSFGNPITVVALTGAIYTYGLIFENDWARETAIIFTSSLIAGGLVQTISKKTVGRSRPYMDLGTHYFEPWPSTDDFHSFVSGHTLVSVSTAHILASRINNIYLKSFFYTLGGIGAWARMYQRNHFSSDVFLGAALSYATVLAAIKWQNSANYDNNNKQKFSFGIDNRQIRFTLFLN